MKFPIVCGDVEREVAALRVLGGTAEVVVLEADGSRCACDRATGAPVGVPTSFTPIAAPGAIVVDRVPLAISPVAVMRDGVPAEPRSEGDQAVTLPGLGALRISPDGGNKRLVPTLIPARGPLVTMQNLVEWTTNDKPNQSFERDTTIPWTLICEPTARVAIIATPRRASWITFETLAAMPRGGHTAECTIVRAPSFPKLDYFWLDRRLDHRAAPGDVVAKALTPAMRKRIADVGEQLFELDLATAATLAIPHREALARRKLEVVVGSLFEDHAKATARTDWIYGDNTAARAARANAELARNGDVARFVSFETLSYDAPSFARVSPAQRAALAKLLELDPELPPLPAPDGPQALARAIAAFGEIGEPAVEWGDHVVIRLSFDDATKLEDFLSYLPS